MGENLVTKTADGNTGVYPTFRENTIHSFQQAAKCGVGFVEFDVQVGACFVNSEHLSVETVKTRSRWGPLASVRPRSNCYQNIPTRGQPTSPMKYTIVESMFGFLLLP